MGGATACGGFERNSRAPCCPAGFRAGILINLCEFLFTRRLTRSKSHTRAREREPFTTVALAASIVKVNHTPSGTILIPVLLPLKAKARTGQTVIPWMTGIL